MEHPLDQERLRGLADALLRLSRRLLEATRVPELLDALADAVRDQLGFHTVWLYLLEDDGRTANLWAASGDLETQGIIPQAVPITGDAMLEQVLTSEEPVVVADARVDPRTNKEIVSALGNRTIINVRVTLADRVLGSLGTGTFNDEGVRVPSALELDFLTTLGLQVAVAVDRLRILAEREALSDQLVRAQKLEAIGQFAGGIAHDFNNILGAILSGSELLSRELATGHPGMAWVHEIQSYVERGAVLSQRLLAFARRQVIEPQAVDLNELVDSMSPMLECLVGSEIACERRLADGLGTVKADPSQLEQVLLNLAVNARDAMPSGGRLELVTRNVSLRARSADQVPAGEWVLLEVRDTGGGMPPAVAAHAFEPFFTTKEDRGGTGLGLATCYGIVKQSGGRITFDSQAGQGTSMRVYLPRSAEPRPDGVCAQLPRGDERILVVEDEEIVRRVVVESLEALGYTVQSAATAEEGRALADAPWDLLVTDVVLPRASGPELAAELRGARPELRVLFVSGFAPGLAGGRLPEGAHFLAKPFTTRQLAQSVRQVLEGSQRPS